MSNLETVKETEDGIEMVEKKKNEHKMDEKTKEKETRNEKQQDVKTIHSSSDQGVDKFATLISRLYGPDYIAARKLLNRRLKQKGMGAKPALSLYDRIMMYRKMKDGDSQDPETKDSEEDTRKIGRTKSNNSLDSVDISQYTNNNNEPRTPTPKPTVNAQQPRKSGSARSVIRRKREQHETLKVEDDDVKATPRDVYVDIKETEQVIEERTTPIQQIRERSREKVVVKEERTVFPPVRSATPQRPSSTTSVRSSEESTSLPPITKEERAIQRETIRQSDMVHETRAANTVVMGALVTKDQSSRTEQRVTKSDTRKQNIDTEQTTESLTRKEDTKIVNKSDTKRSERTDEAVHKETRKSTDENHVNKVQEKSVDKEVRKEESRNIRKEQAVTKEESRNVRKEQAVTKEESRNVRKEQAVRKDESRSVKNEESVQQTQEKNDYNKSVNDEDARAVITSPRTPRQETPDAEKESPPEETPQIPLAAAAAAAAAAPSKAGPSKASSAPSPAAPSANNPPPPRNASKQAKSTDDPPIEPDDDDIAALDKLADYNLKSLMGQDAGDAPKVNSKLMDKVFSPEFQNNLDNFLAAR